MAGAEKPKGTLSFIYFGQFDRSANAACKVDIQGVISQLGLSDSTREAIVAAQDGGSPVLPTVVERLETIARTVRDELAQSIGNPVSPAPFADGLTPDGMVGFLYHLMHDPDIAGCYSHDPEGAVERYIDRDHVAFDAIVAYAGAFLASKSSSPDLEGHLQVIEEALPAELQRSYKRFW